MAYETIIVAYDDLNAADGAVQAVRRMGVPANDIRRHPVGAQGGDDVAAAPEAKVPDRRFWHWLLGRDLNEDQLAGYRRALDRGGTILAIQVMEDAAGEVRAALDRFGPLELREAGEAG